MFLGHRQSRAHAGSCCIMRNPRGTPRVIDTPAQLWGRNNECAALPESPASLRETSPLPPPTPAAAAPSPPGTPAGFPFDWQGPCYFRLGCLTAPRPGLIMPGLFLGHLNPRKTLSDCPPDRDQIGSTCLPG